MGQHQCWISIDAVLALCKLKATAPRSAPVFSILICRYRQGGSEGLCLRGPLSQPSTHSSTPPAAKMPAPVRDERPGWLCKLLLEGHRPAAHQIGPDPVVVSVRAGPRYPPHEDVAPRLCSLSLTGGGCGTCCCCSCGSAVVCGTWCGGGDGLCGQSTRYPISHIPPAAPHLQGASCGQLSRCCKC